MLSLLYILRSLEFYKVLNFTIGQLALPVHLAGLDWNNLISSSEYYGYGFKWVLAPLYQFASNSYYIYIYAIIIYASLTCIMGNIFYKIAIAHWHMESNIFLAIIWGCVFRVQDPVDAYTSEIAIFLSFFITCIIVIKLIENSKYKKVLSVFLSFWLCYMITLHERALVVFLAFLILLFLYKIVYSSFLVDMRFFLPGVVFFLMFEKFLTKEYRLFFWKEKVLHGNLNNTSVIISNKTWFLESLHDLNILLEEIAANILTLTLHTYGLFPLMISLLLIGLIVFIKFRKRTEIQCFFEQNKSVIVIIIFSAVATLGIICGMGINWGGQIAAGKIYAYKGYGYYRYFLVYIWPAFLGTLILVPNIKCRKIKNFIFLFSILFFLGLEFFWSGISEKMDLINKRNSEVKLERIGIFEFVEGLVPTDAIDMTIKICFILLIVIAFCIKWKKTYKWPALIVITLNFLCISNCGQDLHWPDFRKDDFYEVYDFFQQTEENIILPQTIYVDGSSYNIKKSQLLLHKYSIIKYDKAFFDSDNECIVISWRAPLTELIESGWKHIKLDNGATIYMNGIDLSGNSNYYEVVE